MHKTKPVDYTYEIISWKHLNQSVDEKWSKWAVNMMMVGYETEYLVELAGIEKPYNQFELKELTDKVFDELNIDFTNQDKVVTYYATYLGSEVINENRELLKNLREIKGLCIALNYDSKIYDTVQWYWDGADRRNIDKIYIDFFKKWIDKN